MKLWTAFLLGLALWLTFSAYASGHEELAPESGVTSRFPTTTSAYPTVFKRSYDPDVRYRAYIWGWDSYDLPIVLLLTENGEVIRLQASTLHLGPNVTFGESKESFLGGKLGLIQTVRFMDKAVGEKVEKAFHDALMHMTLQQEGIHRHLGGMRMSVSGFMPGHGDASGKIGDAEKGFPADAMSELVLTLNRFISHEANEDHVRLALWQYQEATKQRREDAPLSFFQAKPPAPKQPEASSILSQHLRIRPVAFTDIPFPNALKEIKAFVNRYRTDPVGITYSWPASFAEKPVKMEVHGATLKEVLEALAHQTSARLEYVGTEVRFIPLKKTVPKPENSLFDLFPKVEDEPR